MTYRVELAARAGRDLRRIYRAINAGDSRQAHTWFNGVQVAILSLDEFPARAAVTPENPGLRHLLYGNRPHIYRVVFEIDDRRKLVSALHVRHGPRQPLYLGPCETARSCP
jgi:toxin ParE1/3/4